MHKLWENKGKRKKLNALTLVGIELVTPGQEARVLTMHLHNNTFDSRFPKKLIITISLVSCPDPPSGGCGERDTHQKEGLGTRLQ